jgi:membrane protease subunit (stomatin/prohibitin family)
MLPANEDDLPQTAADHQMTEVLREMTASQQNAFHRAMRWWANGAQHRETLAEFCVECGLSRTEAEADADEFLARHGQAA